MPYPNLPDRAIPYHIDGTVVKLVTAEEGVKDTLSAADMLELNNEDITEIPSDSSGNKPYVVFFFPEKRTVTGIYALANFRSTTLFNQKYAPTKVEGSNNSTNGVDGDWIEANGTINPNGWQFDAWRDDIGSVDFSGGSAFETIRIYFDNVGGFYYNDNLYILHLYGAKEAGQTVDDLVFIDADGGGTAEFDLPLDFGAVGAGESDIYQSVKVKNESVGSAANSITLTVTDPDDIIRVGTNVAGPWLTSLDLGNLGPGSVTDPIYVKSEPAAPPTPLRPERAVIDVEVGSWS